jgi:hypothetical protein
MNGIPALKGYATAPGAGSGVRSRSRHSSNGKRLNIRGVGEPAVGVPVFSPPLTVAVDWQENCGQSLF